MSGLCGVGGDPPGLGIQRVRDDQREIRAGGSVVTLKRGGHSFSTQSASVEMSTLSRSDTGPSSSTFHREASAVVNEEYKESGE
eukprot:3156362-Pleurochrysis_carterae.AAC.1